MPEIHGSCAPGFEAVAEAFAGNWRADPPDGGADSEVGAACSVMLDGEVVVDLWAGLADRETGRAWQADTPVLIFSCSKGLSSAVVLRLVERGVLELDAPIARVWPEFAAQGKGGITLRQVLTHQAGLAAVDGSLRLEDILAWKPVCDAIAAQAPNWPPGSAHGYHARSFGWILGETVRRATGASLGSQLATEIAGPLGLDCWIGLPDVEQSRVAKLIPAPEPSDPEKIALREKFMGPDTLLGRVVRGPSNLFDYGTMWNDPALRAAEMPASNGVASARALARFYAALIGTLPGSPALLAPESLAAATRVQVEGPDKVIHVPTRFGLGFMLPPALAPGCGARAFGHPGAGGSLAFADPEYALSFGYAMNQLAHGVLGDPRAARLVGAVYDAIGPR